MTTHTAADLRTALAAAGFIEQRGTAMENRKAGHDSRATWWNRGQDDELVLLIEDEFETDGAGDRTAVSGFVVREIDPSFLDRRREVDRRIARRTLWGATSLGHTRRRDQRRKP